MHAARGELARQAVTEERLRLARDLHDLLGHTLSLITLKSELAGRLLEKEPARAAQEIHEIEREARRALREMREAVAGYRQPTLDNELAGARQMLPPAIDTVLAWTIREGVTNVIRHSRARVCTIRVKKGDGKVWAEVINDGYREKERETTPARIGSGLSGLTERIAACGGHIEASPLFDEGHPGYRLRVALPIRSDEVVERKLER